MARVVGIDLGTYAVKLTLLEGNYRKHNILRHRIRELPQDGSSVPSFEAQIDALAEMLAVEQLDPSIEAAVGYPAEKASFRTLILPFADRAQVAKILPFEIEDHVPFDLDLMLLDYAILSAQEGRSHILAGLAERTRLGERIAALKGIGLDPKNMPFDADLLSLYGGDGVQAVLDIGHTRTLVVLLRDGATWGVRALDGGGRDITLGLQKAFDLDYASAESMKRLLSCPHERDSATAALVGAEWMEDDRTAPVLDMPPADPARPLPDRAAMERVLEESLQELFTGIRSTLIGFEDLLGAEIGEVLLCGGTSAIDGLAARLGDELGLPVRSVMVSAPDDARVTDGVPGQYALSSALALRAAGDLPYRVLELRKGPFQYRGRVRTLQNMLLLGAAAFCATVLVGAGVFAMKHHELSAQIDDVEGQIRDSVTTSFPDVEPGRLKDIGTAISIMQGKTLLVTSRVDALGPALLGQPPMLTLLKDLSDAMPPAKEARIDIRELTLSEAAASFTAETDGYEAAAKIEASLQRKSRFKRAAKGEEKKVGEGVSFSLTIPLKESSESEEIAMEVTVAAEPAAPEPVSVEPEKPPVTPPGAGSAKLARPDVKVRAKARKKKETMP